MSLDPALFQVIALSLGALFLLSGLQKAMDLRRFSAVVARYELLPRGFATIAAFGIVMFEIAAGIAALSMVTGIQGVALQLLALLLLLYAAAVAFNLLRGRRDIDCGCAGPAARDRGIAWDMVGRNLLLAGLALSAALSPISARPLVWLDWATIFGGVAAFALLYLTVELAFALAARQQEARAS